MLDLQTEATTPTGSSRSSVAPAGIVSSPPAVGVASGVAAEPAAYAFSENASVSLDLIRAISAQMVVFGHGISFLNIALWLHEPNFPWIQNIGVLIFFLLSGLLITQSTLRKTDRPGRAYGFRQFFIERFARIYSGYVPAMCLVVVLDLLFIKLYGRSAYPYHFDLKTFVGNLFMLQDYPLLPLPAGVTSLGSARPFWTLAIEWWIYMFFGWAIFGRSMVKNRSVYLAVLAFAGVVPYFNSVVAGRGNGLFVVWMMGSVLALALSRSVRGQRGRLSPAAGIVTAALLAAAGTAHAWMARTAYDLIFASFLVASLYFAIRALDDMAPAFGPKLKKGIRFIADYSFSLYLIHYSVFWLLVPLADKVSPYLLFGAGVLVANLLSAVFALFTEMRHRDLARYLLARS